MIMVLRVYWEATLSYSAFFGAIIRSENWKHAGFSLNGIRCFSSQVSNLNIGGKASAKVIAKRHQKLDILLLAEAVGPFPST